MSGGGGVGEGDVAGVLGGSVSDHVARWVAWGGGGA